MNEYLNEYHKIQTVYKRDPATKHRTLLEGEFSIPEFEYLKDNEWILTEKVDGTNIRVVYNGNDVKFKGRTDRAQLYVPLFDRLTELFPVDKMKAEFPDSPFAESDESGVCLYGEGYGARIQKGGGNYKPDGVDFVLFDIRIGQWWLKRSAIEEIADNLGIKTVPIVGIGSLLDAVEFCRKGFNSKWGNFQAEGLVMRPRVELFSRNRRRIIAKIKHKDFIK